MKNKVFLRVQNLLQDLKIRARGFCGILKKSIWLIFPKNIQRKVVSFLKASSEKDKRVQQEVCLESVLNKRRDSGNSLEWCSEVSHILGVKDLDTNLLEYSELFLRAVEERRALQNFSRNFIEKFEKACVQIDHKALGCEGWLNLAYLTFLNGLFYSACLIRDKAIERALSQDEGDSLEVNVLIKAFKAAVDCSDFMSAERSLNRLEKILGMRKYSQNVKAYLLLNKGEVEKARKILTKKFNRQDRKFARYIRNKSVAVVGPASSEKSLENEINSFDVVIRNNLISGAYSPKGIKAEYRADCSYYNGWVASEICKKNQIRFLEQYDYCMFKYIEFDYQKSFKKRGKAREAKMPVFFFNGSPNMIPIILYDLLNFEPNRIKVFNVNFYLAKTVYKKDYYNKEMFKGRRSLAAHDALSNFNFVRNLYKVDLIEADEECTFVLEMSPQEYSKRLEEYY
jgi:hypothetical protein